MKLARSASFVLIAFLSVSPLLADDDSRQVHNWLSRMSHAMHSINYEGTFVLAHDGKLESMHIIHKVDGRGEHERLISLNGSAREVIRDNERITCILPDSKSVVVDKSRPKQFFPFSLGSKNISRLEKFYEFMMGKEDRIAGRSAQVITIKPRDTYRYGYRLWIDKDSGVLLKSDMVNTGGEAIEQMMYTSIRVNQEIPEQALVPQITGKEYRWFKDDSKHVAVEKMKTGWEVSRLPQGYMMSERNHHRLPAGKMPVEHMVYTDGLATVSIYIEKLQNKHDSLRGVSHMGAVHAYGDVIRDHQVTVVGEVPQLTVELIGHSVQFMQK